jgi:apolipoprotein N-acyltransferase
LKSIFEVTMKKKAARVGKPGVWKGYGDWKIFLLRVLAVAWTVAQYPLLNITINWWPLHWVAWVPFFWAIHAQEGQGNLWLSYAGGTMGHIFLFSWIASFIPNFSNVPKPAAMLLLFGYCSYLSLFWILLAVFVPRFRKRFPRAWIWLVPALVTAAEFLLPQIFPYTQGLTQYRVVPLFQLSSVTGVYGVTFLLMLGNCLVFHALSLIRSGRPFPRKPAAGFLVIMLLVLSYGWWRQVQYRRTETTAPSLKAGMIQSNITPREHRRMGYEKIHELYLEMSREAVTRGADWIIWSEGEFKPPLNSGLARDVLLEDSRSLNRPILLGGFYLRYENGRRVVSNSAIHVDPVNGLGERYDKRFLVPFGEYQPFSQQLGFIYRHISHRPNLSPGKDPVVQRLRGIPYGFLICYEAIFPSLVRETVRAGARLLVNITYDAWFGKTAAPFQHLWLASARCAENGVPMIRLGTTGISTIVNSLGQMDSLSPLFERKVLVEAVKLVWLPGLYTRIGNVFAWACVFCSLLGLAWLRFPKKRFRPE